MVETYTLVVQYPDGHEEEIGQTFLSLDKAKDYGKNLLQQVANTEQVFRGGGDGGFSFIVYLNTSEGRVIVFDSSVKEEID